MDIQALPDELLVACLRYLPYSKARDGSLR